MIIDERWFIILVTGLSIFVYSLELLYCYHNIIIFIT